MTSLRSTTPLLYLRFSNAYFSFRVQNKENIKRGTFYSDFEGGQVIEDLLYKL